MFKKLFLSIFIMLTASTVIADTIFLYDKEGKQAMIDTSTLSGCVIVFDSVKRPLELCRMEAVTNNSTVVVPSNSTSTVVVPGYKPNVHVVPDRAQDRATSRRVYRRMERRHN